MKNTDKRDTDELFVEQTRLRLVAKNRARLVLLLYGAIFIGVCVFGTVRAIQKIDTLDVEQLTLGLIWGALLGVSWSAFGVAGALCLGKSLAGFANETRAEKLMLTYYDRLAELKQLPSNVPH
jgi:hypothetical protein